MKPEREVIEVNFERLTAGWLERAARQGALGEEDLSAAGRLRSRR